jgi:hypothetical protein
MTGPSAILLSEIKENAFVSACRSGSFNAFVKENAMQSQFRSRLTSQYYCWIGIVLACMAILLAASFGPKGAYYRDQGTVLDKGNYPSQQAAWFNDSSQVGQR